MLSTQTAPGAKGVEVKCLNSAWTLPLLTMDWCLLICDSDLHGIRILTWGEGLCCSLSDGKCRSMDFGLGGFEPTLDPTQANGDIPWEKGNTAQPGLWLDLHPGEDRLRPEPTAVLGTVTSLALALLVAVISSGRTTL